MAEKTTALLAGPDYVSDCTGSQVYVSRYGEPIFEVFSGQRSRGDAMTQSTKISWLCGSKPPLVLALVQSLAAAGLDEDEFVARFIPEFAQAGKGEVTLNHVLTHTVPYQELGLYWTNEGSRGNQEEDLMMASWDDALAMICKMPLFESAGAAVTYTSMANWHVLAVVLERLTGRSHEEVIAETVLKPLGMDSTRFYLDERDTAAVSLALLTDLDSDGEPRIAGLDSGTLLFARLPGLACRGPARDLAKAVECAVGWRDRDRIDPGWRAKLVEPRRTELPDPVFQGADVLWSLGLCADPMCYGLPLSKRAVGYTGFRSSMVFADIDAGITLSFISNGMVPKARDWARKRKLVRAVYDDLDLPLADAA